MIHSMTRERKIEGESRRQSEKQGVKMGRRIFNNLRGNVCVCSIISSDQFLMRATFS